MYFFTLREFSPQKMDENIELIILLLLAQNENDISVILLRRRMRRNYLHSNEWRDNYLFEALDDQFINNFKMNKSTFSLVLEKILAADRSLDRDVIAKSLLIFLYYSTRSITFRDLGDKFGRTTHYCRCAIKRITDFFIKNLESFIKLPHEDEYEELSSGFTRYSELAGTILAVDGMHIYITKPKYNTVNYINRHSTSSVNYMISCDYKGRIRSLYGPCFGSSHDSFVFSGGRFKDWIQSLPVGFHVIGDNAYPRNEHLLVPRLGQLSRDDMEYNYRLSAQRNKIECTIGALKNKFSKLASRIRNGDREFYKKIVYSCSCIHNLLIDIGENV